MKIKTEVNLQCNTPEEVIKCADNIFKKIEDKYGKFYNEETKQASGHVSISHKNGKHIIWIFCYDSKGLHESEKKNKTITKKVDNVIKYTGKKITVNEIKKMFE